MKKYYTIRVEVTVLDRLARKMPKDLAALGIDPISLITAHLQARDDAEKESEFLETLSTPAAELTE
jgi:hypothetical protein